MTGVELAGLVWGSLATVGALAAAFARWRASSDETASALWKEEAAAWKAKAERLEQSLLDLTRRVDTLEAQNEALRSMHDTREDISALRIAMVTGFASLQTILKEGK